MSDQFSLPEIAESPLIWYYSWLPKFIFFFIQVHRARRNGGPGLSTYWQGRFRPRLSYTGIFLRRSDIYLIKSHVPFRELCLIKLYWSGVFYFWVLEGWIARNWLGRFGRHDPSESRGYQEHQTLDMLSYFRVVWSFRKQNHQCKNTSYQLWPNTT